MSGYTVTVGDNHYGIGNAQCGATGGNTRRREKIDVYCDPALKGRFVRIKLTGRKILNLCEVKVFGQGGGDARPAGIDEEKKTQISEIYLIQMHFITILENEYISPLKILFSLC